MESGSGGLVLGTAGHIDHGKSALVRALTGVDPDRLPEEKARGITIDLGFARLDLGNGEALSLVDVPGHERLVRTMVAGATGIDLLLLVVAADEGVMPQTREHVAICQLLGIDRGVVAISKSDLVDEEMLELAREEVRDLLRGTGLEGAALLPVSSETGDGVEALREALAGLANDTPPRTVREGAPRLFVDRAFEMRGFGAVVTGTLTGSALETGAAVELVPSGRSARIRGLQTHGESRERVLPGSRCAVNLQGVEVGELARGELLTLPDTLRATALADVSLHWLPSAPEVDDTVSVQLLAGTARRLAHLAPIGRDGIVPGTTGFARLHVDDGALPLLPGDRFIVRGFARSEGMGGTVGGGVVLDVAPPHRRRTDPVLLRELEILAGGELRAGLRERIRRAGFEGAETDGLRRETGALPETLRVELQALVADGEILAAGAHRHVATASLERMQETLLEALDAFHRDQPLRPGMARAALRGELADNVPGEIADLALARLEAAGEIQVEGKLVRRAGRAPEIDGESKELLERIRSEALRVGLEPPSPRDWANELGVDADRFRDLVAHLEREGELVRAPGDLWFARGAVESLRTKVVAHLEAHGEIDPAAYKQLTGTTRRTTVPLMELLDELHVTRRRDNVRVLRKG